MTRPFTVGSVCSGIGAPEVAWRELGWRYVWSADIDNFANAVRATHFPDVPNLGDMTLIADRIIAGEIEAPDGLVGGTPCQSFSLAGLRGGLRDQRGNLALEFIRIADAIDAVRRAADLEPAFVLWENVPGIFSDKGNAFGTFLAELVGSNAPLVSRGGWTSAGVVDGPTRCAAWRVLDAQHFGLAQRRERVFVLARGGARSWSAADALLPILESVQWHPAPSREARKAAARPLGAGSAGSGGYRHDADTADNLITSTLDASYGKLQGASGQDANHGHSLLVPLAFGGNNTAGPIELAPALLAQPGSGYKGDFDSETFIAHTTPISEVEAFNNTGQGWWNPAGTAATVRKGDDMGGGGARESTLVACGFDATPLYCLLNEDRAGPIRTDPTTFGVISFDTTQITHPENRSNPKPGAPCHSLAAGAQPPAIATAMAVRRLTPRECERLQGFPDDFTLIEMSRRVKVKIEADFAAYLRRSYPGITLAEIQRLSADGPRYRALGNSMAVPVLAWIGRRIAAVAADEEAA